MDGAGRSLRRGVGRSGQGVRLARRASNECLFECVLFEWFLRDLALIDEFGRHAEDIRRALRGRLLIDLQRNGVSPASLEGFDQVSHERFAEYREALESSSSLQALGHRVWLRIQPPGAYGPQQSHAGHGYSA